MNLKNSKELKIFEKLKKVYNEIMKPIFENLQKVDEILTKPFFEKLHKVDDRQTNRLTDIQDLRIYATSCRIKKIRGLVTNDQGQEILIDEHTLREC